MYFAFGPGSWLTGEKRGLENYLYFSKVFFGPADSTAGEVFSGEAK